MKNSFVMYTDYMEQIEMLTDEQAGVLFKALISYQAQLNLPEMDGITEMAFRFIKKQIDRDNEKYDVTVKKRSEAGKKSAENRANAKCVETNSTKSTSVKCVEMNSTKSTDNDNENDNDNVNDNDIRERVKERPTLAQIKSACKEKNIRQVNPEVFYAYYKSRDWIVNGKDISSNWIDYLELWEIREKEKFKPKPRSDIAMKTEYDFDALEKELLGISRC